VLDREDGSAHLGTDEPPIDEKDEGEEGERQEREGSVRSKPVGTRRRHPRTAAGEEWDLEDRSFGHEAVSERYQGQVKAADT
jgi:hypothetical protein